MGPIFEFMARRKARKLKEKQGFGRDILIISYTGFSTFADPKSDLHKVIQKSRQAKVMLLNPFEGGSGLRVKSTPHPNVHSEKFVEHMRNSIEFLKSIRKTKKNIRLKLYPEVPFLNLSVLGDRVWIKYYPLKPGKGTPPEYSYGYDANQEGLYSPFCEYFYMRWNDPRNPEYDLETDELIYTDTAGNEVRRKRVPHLKNMRSFPAVSCPPPAPANGSSSGKNGSSPGAIPLARVLLKGVFQKIR